MTTNALVQVLLDQQEEAQAVLKSPLVDRDKSQEFSEMAQSKLIKVVSGVRRCGKSTFCLQAHRKDKFVYINFDDERLLSILKGNLTPISETLKEAFSESRVLILDEIQNAPQWELFANRLKREGYRLTLTGSNSKLLSQELATHLTGRHLNLELSPFSFKEFLKFQQRPIPSLEKISTSVAAEIKKQFLIYFEKGGFPETSQGEPVKLYLQELYRGIVSNDIIQRKGIKHLRLFRELAHYLFSSVSSHFTFHSLTRQFQSKSVNTIKNYVSYLEEAYLLFVPEVYSVRVKERSSLPRKPYMVDIGFSEALSLGRSSDDLGRKLENLVYLELRRRGLEVWSFHETQFEVDFTVRSGRNCDQLIQVAWNIDNEKTLQRELVSLKKATKRVKCRDLLILTYETEKDISFEGLNVKVLPVWKWLLV